MVDSGGSITTSHCVITNAATIGSAMSSIFPFKRRCAPPSNVPATIQAKYPMPNHNGPTMIGMAADVDQIRSDLKMIMAERKTGGGADILHRTGYGETDREQDRCILPAIE